jgi:hypothetical protein
MESDWSTMKSLAPQELSSLRPSSSRGVRGSGRSGKPRSWQCPQVQSKQEEETSSTTTSMSNDSRRSILECDINPYLLLKNQQQRRSCSGKDEDDLSDDLSDNALELEPRHSIGSSHSSSNLFDSSKVKSIERIPNRSSVAAIGGQRIRVFNEAREPSDDEDGHVPLQPTLTRIPIPKISPKRPPRRLKEAKNALKSILKRADKSLFTEPRRKKVLFNVDNIILAPEKPVDMCSRYFILLSILLALLLKPSLRPGSHSLLPSLHDYILFAFISFFFLLVFFSFRNLQMLCNDVLMHYI